MDPEQAGLGPHCLPYRLRKHLIRREKQTTFVAIGALRVKDQSHELVEFMLTANAAI